MASGKLDRIAVVVDDLEAVARDLERVFGMEFTIVDVPSMGIKVGLGGDGIELVQKIDDDCDLERLWSGPMAAMVMTVPDVEAVRADMAAIGVEADHDLETDGGLKEISFGKNFHGLHIVVCDSKGDLVHEVGAGDGAASLAPTINRD